MEQLKESSSNPVLFSPQHRVSLDAAGSYGVDGLKPDTLYGFSLAARSEMGLGVFTETIEARTAQSSKQVGNISSTVLVVNNHLNDTFHLDLCSNS